jgi:hypothetical protein
VSLGTIFFVAIGVSFVVIYFASYRVPQIRDQVRRTYANVTLPYPFRMAPVVAPIFAASLILLGVAPALPHRAALWAFEGVVVFGTGFLILAYRVPPTTTPSWLRKEILEGITPLSRPDRWAEVLLFVTLPVFFLAAVLLPIQIFTGAIQ